MHGKTRKNISNEGAKAQRNHELESQAKFSGLKTINKQYSEYRIYKAGEPGFNFCIQLFVCALRVYRGRTDFKIFSVTLCLCEKQQTIYQTIEMQVPVRQLTLFVLANPADIRKN